MLSCTFTINLHYLTLSSVQNKQHNNTNMDSAAYELAMSRLQIAHAQYLNVPLNPPNLQDCYEGTPDWCYESFMSELFHRNNHIVSRAVCEEYWALLSRKKAMAEHPGMQPTNIIPQT